MNEKKDITINNAAFSITIHWNGPVVSTQLCIMAGLILLGLFAGNHDVKVLCLVIGLVDVISIIVVMLCGSSVEGAEEKPESKDTVKLDKKSDTVSTEKEPATKTEPTNKSHKSSEETSKTIKKKVPMPTQKGVRKAEPVTAQPEPLQSEKKEEPVVEEKTEPTKPVEEMSDEDLNSLFDW